MPEFACNDVTLHYETEGAGPPLLLLAGMLSDSATWALFAPLLTAKFTVIRPDNRATGRTTPWDATVSCAEMTQDMLDLMTHLGHDMFHVAGHSMGGLLTMELAFAAPDRVVTATVLASGRVRMPRTVAVFDALMAIRRAPEGEMLWLRALYPWIFGQAFFEDPETVQSALQAALAYPHAQTANAMAHQIEMFRNFRPKARLENITCPLLVIYAGQDLLVPPALAKPSFAAAPNLHEVTIEHAGHSIVWDAPDEVAQHMHSFLEQHPMAT